MSARRAASSGLLAVETLRKEVVRQAQLALSSARGRLEEAERGVLAARAALCRHMDASPATPTGRMSGTLARRAGARREHHQLRRRELERHLATAQGTLQGARQRHERAREALREAHLEAQLVARYRERKRAEADQQRLRRRLDEDDDRQQRLS